jgi:tetratricopeptide (TPR) repeat protein
VRSLRRRTVVAVFLLAACGTAARADAAKAFADYKAGRYLEAAAEMQAVVDRSPGYAYGYLLLGHCMLKTKQPRQAGAYFRRALELDPTRPEYYQGLALAMRAEANWRLVVSVTTDGLQHARDDETRFAFLKLRGYAFGTLQAWNLAVRDLEAARRIHPEPSVLVLLGKAYFAMGENGSAVLPLQIVLQSAPDQPSVIRLLAECYLRLAAGQRDPSRKVAYYVKSLEYAQNLSALTPNDMEAVNLVGRAALGAGRLDQAERVFLHVLNRDPRQCYAMVNLGRTYFAAERWTDAEVVLRRAAACAPRMAAVYETLGELYLKRGQPQEAAAAFRRAEEIEPTEPDPVPFPAEPGDSPGTINVSGPR